MVQVNNSPIILRVAFTKLGSLQYVSHLDLVRTMNKIVVRAGLPLWYTEGFNPKPKLVFAAPLSIGTESKVELLDIRLSEKISPSAAMKVLNENMTEEMQVYDAYYPTSKLTELKWISYRIGITTDGATPELAQSIERTLLDERVEIEKRTKSGENISSDVRPLIKSASAALKNGEIELLCTLSADSSSFLNPEHLIRLLKAKFGILSSDNLLSEYYSIMRISAHREDMSQFR